MENIINKIIKIDEEARSIKQNTKKRLHNNEKELKETLDDLEKKIMNDAKAQIEKQCNSIISEATESSEKIIAKGNAEYSKLDNIFFKMKNEIEEKIWSSII